MLLQSIWSKYHESYRLVPLQLPPLFFCTLTLMLGIGSTVFAHAWVVYVLLGLGFVLQECKSFPVPESMVRASRLAIACFVLGACSSYYQRFNHERFYTQWGNKKVTCEGIVRSIDVVMGRSKQYKVRIQLQRLYTDILARDWSAVSGDVLVYMRYPRGLAVGDTVQCAQVTIKESKNKDFDKYLTKEGVVTSFFVSTHACSVVHHPTYCWARSLAGVQARFMTAMRCGLDKETFAFFSSIFMGSRDNVKRTMEEYKEQFKRWGISHQLARSGLHMVIFVSLWTFLLGYIPLPFVVKQLMLFAVSLLYFMLSWSSITFVRAFALFVLYTLCFVLRLRPHFLHLLCLVTLVVLLLNPAQLFFLDFQLSFGLTFALGWLSHVRAMHAIQFREHPKKNAP